MGSAASNAQTNDELVEYLLQNCYVHKKKVEIVFRAVDRADYVLSSHQESAYNDVAWKHGNLHISAPCVYGVAMEYLSLKPGQSFLNIGSGTGYLSTMAGLLLGPYGINHGIELHEDCIHYARERLDNFKQNSQAFEEFEFCEPFFVQGNCLRVVPIREYDTVYCGAAVSDSNIADVKRFVRIGGSIVMPYKGRLCCFKRINETSWACKKSLGVSFATLVTPDPSDQSSIVLPDCEPLSLQELCRNKIRQILRKNVWTEHPELEKRNLTLIDKHPRNDSFYDQSDDGVSDDDDDEGEDEDDDEEGNDDDDDDDDEAVDGHIIRRTRFLFNMEVDSNETTSNPVGLRRVAMLVQQRIGAEQQRAEASLDRIPEERRNDDLPTAAGSLDPPVENASSDLTGDQVMEESSNLAVNPPLNEPQASQLRQRSSGGRQARNRGRSGGQKNTRDSDSERERDSECDSDDELLMQWRKIAKRENTDSGIVDDDNIAYDDTTSSYNANQSDFDNTSSSSNPNQSDSNDEDGMDVDLSSVALRETFRQVCGSLTKDLSPRRPASEHPDSVESRTFVIYMREKILRLPLPTKLKLFINHNRNL